MNQGLEFPNFFRIFVYNMINDTITKIKKMKKTIILLFLLILSSCTHEELIKEFTNQAESNQTETIPLSNQTQNTQSTTKPIIKLYKESYLNQRSGISFWWSQVYYDYVSYMDDNVNPRIGFYGNGHAYGDVNNDGYQDILVSYHVTENETQTGELLWYINSGNNKHFKSTRKYFNKSTLGFNAHKLLKTDVNNDNIADYIALGVVEIPGNYGGNFTVLIGKSNGTFDVNDIPNQDKLWFHNGAAGDLNGDSFVDVITATHIWFGDGKGNFTKTIGLNDLPYVKDALTYEILDMDKDGWNDLILRGPHDTRATIVLNNKGIFDNRNKIIYLPTPTYKAVQDFELIDLDNDGDIDVVEMAQLGGNNPNTNDFKHNVSSITVYYNNNMSFTKDEKTFSESIDGNYLHGEYDYYGWSVFKFDDIDGDGQDEILSENYQDGKYNALKKIDGKWKKVVITFGK